MDATHTHEAEKSQSQLSVTVPAEEFRLHIDKAGKQLAKAHDFKGFRPGKAPLAFVVEKLGHERVLREAMDLALPHFFVQAALDHDIEPINRPNITVEELGMDTPFRFTATVEVLPKVTLGDVSKISAEKREVKVSDEDVEQELTYLAKMRSTYADVTRPAKNEDVVTIDFTIKEGDALLPGGESKNHPLTLGEGQFIPEFESGIIGMSKDETKSFPVTFPKDFPTKELQGKTVEATVTVHAVQERVLPELNDDFAKQLGSFENMKSLKEELKKNIGLEREQKEKDRYQGELAQKLAEASTFGPIAPTLLEREIESRIQELTQMLSYQGKTIEKYLEDQKKTMEELKAEITPEAEKHIKAGLVLRQLGKEHNVTVTDEEVEEKVQAQLSTYKTPKQASEQVDIDQLKDRITTTLYNKKTLEKLVELAKK